MTIHDLEYTCEKASEVCIADQLRFTEDRATEKQLDSRL